MWLDWENEKSYLQAYYFKLMTKKELLYFFGILALLSTLNTEDSLILAYLKKDPGYKAEKPCNTKRRMSEVL